jgi:phospholipid-binding lipoprotein MlaA
MSSGFSIFGLLRCGAAGAALLALTACVNPADEPTYATTADPIEPFNRYMFELNRAGDEFLGKPLANIYRGTVPDPARESVGNALANLRLPWTAVNDVLQGEFSRAGSALTRFALNSTFGFFGLFDMARDVGYTHHDEDFGQTLGAWGAGGDPYLMLPVFGPSSPRDVVGMVVDGAIDPVTVIAQGGAGWGRGNGFTAARSATGFVAGRERTLEALAELERGQDYYAAVRSAYRQRRAVNIRNEETPGIAAPPRFRFGADTD